MKVFKFKEFEILQQKGVFKVGTDAVLLGAFINVENAKYGLEIGSGTGIISLMLAQRNTNLNITALEISEKAYQLSELNFQNAPFSSRIKAIHESINDFKPINKYDLIFCNPPYFDAKSTQHQTFNQARLQVDLNHEDIVLFCSKYLEKNGSLQLIIPYLEAEKFILTAKQYLLFCTSNISIKGNPNTEIKRSILTFKKEKKELFKQIFIIEKSHRIYSDEYRTLTQDFHPNF